MAAPGCFGKIVNILDSSNTVARNWLLTDKPHMEAKTHHAETLGVSSLSKSQGNGTKMLFMDQIEDKMIVSELRRSSSLKKANEIPMNVLIAQDGSKEFEPKHTSTNVVARLMGLDTMPISHRSSAEQRRSEIHSRRCLSQSEMLMCSEHQGDLLDTKMQFEGSHHLEQNKHADLYEMWKKLQKENAKNNSLQSHNGRIYNEIKKKKMAFVRQKFVEAKCLASDEKGRQSKEFQDALEVLSSNKELFLKFLQEPSSLFTLNLHHTSVSQPCETTHITVLRPSKNGDVKLFGPEKMANKETKNQAQMGRATVYHKNTDQPTRIVVLKPSPARAPEMKAVFSSPTPSSRKSPREGFFYCESKAKENMWKMQKNVIGHQMKGNVASSMFSNTNAGDSSCNKSETEYVLENISDSEVVSPSSRHSWEYIKKTGSPFNSSFSQPMCSPVSSVSREAKMRLSDRWAMMTPIDVFHEESNAWRSSSTLGEMLALSNSMKFTKTEELATSKNPAPELSTSSFICNMNAEKSVVGSPKFLLRSKSASLSSTVYFPLVNPKASPILETNDVSEGVLQQKRHKSSFKMKVKASRKIQGNGEYQHVENSDQKECSPQSLHGSSKSVYLDLAQPQNKPGLVFEEICIGGKKL